MKIVFRASNILEAHIVAGLLINEGIEAFVAGHYLQGAVGDLPATDFALVRVKDVDEASAVTLIAQYEQNLLNS